MKNSSRLERIPAPISLSKRSVQAQPDSTTPYRMEWGSPLQPIENSSSMNTKMQKSSISNMKEELSNIKTDVEKLLNEDCQETRKNQPSELISKSVRAELEYHKQVEEKLRAEIRELKVKLSEEKMIREERDALTKRMEQIRQEEKIEKAKLKKSNEEAAIKYAQDAAKWQADYDALLHKFNTISQEFAALQQTSNKEKGALLKTVGELERELSYKNEEFEASLRVRQSKYESALSEFKKLQVKFDKNTQENVLTLMHKNMALEQQISNMANNLEDAKLRYGELTVRYQRVNQQNEEIRTRNSELEYRMRQPNRQNDVQVQLEGLRSVLQSLEASKAQLYTTYLEKCRQLEELQDAYNTNINIPSAEIQRLKIENAEYAKMDEILNDQLNHARERIKYLQIVMAQKDSYIEAMEDSQPNESTNQVIRDLEEKCRQLLHEKMKIVRDYENAIRTLENSMAESRENSLNQSFSFSGISRNSTFDEALKEQIQENQELRTAVRQKGHEIFELKGQVEELKRVLETHKNEKELEKMRIQSQQKSLKSSYEITVQDLRYQLDSLKRKQEGLERKLEMKMDDIKKKDQFIQKSIVGRVGKQESETDVQYLTKQLERFIQLSIADHIRYV